MKLLPKRLSSFQIIFISFASLILVGVLLLCLPFAVKGEDSASFSEALFTATSAVCVTGLVVQDTATYWSGFGHGVILCLIQIGGLGIVTVAMAISYFTGKSIGLKQRSTMQEAIAAPQVGGIVKLTRFILRFTLIMELAGTIALAPVFCDDFGIIKGIWYSLFHSISAFCNAGFDLMGINAPFSSFTGYVSNPLLNATIMLLIIFGGLGFLTWSDITTHKFRLKRYRMQSKVILSTTFLLLLLPALFFYFKEFGALNGKERVFSSLFLSTTARTAGFNTVDMASLGGVTTVIMIGLMLIGGSPGSTAGGLKTTTFAVLLSTAVSVFRRKDNTHFYGRRVPSETIRNAATILMMYLVLFLVGGCIISVVEGLPIGVCLFETASAIGTVGVSAGITAELGLLSRGILIVLMFCGRVGGLTLIFAATAGGKIVPSMLPQEKITVG